MKNAGEMRTDAVTGSMAPLVVFSRTEQNSLTEVYDVLTSPDINAVCVVMGSVKPTTHICCYNISEDTIVSGSLRSRSHSWELNSLLMIQREMRKDPNMAFIDLGANLGVFSLVVANMGHKVIAVEPLTKTIRLLAKSIRIGKLTDNIVLLKNAISDKRQIGTIMIDRTNKGGSLVVDRETCSQSTVCEHIKLIYMDDLLPFITFNKAILKMDIEKQEHCAIQYAARLFDKVHIPYIIMEWVFMKSLYHIPRSQDHLKVERAIHFLFQRGYIVTVLNATHYVVPIPQTLHWTYWPNEIIWKYVGTNELQRRNTVFKF